jgi:hypothetical protein
LVQKSEGVDSQVQEAIKIILVLWAYAGYGDGMTDCNLPPKQAGDDPQRRIENKQTPVNSLAMRNVWIVGFRGFDSVLEPFAIRSRSRTGKPFGIHGAVAINVSGSPSDEIG